MNEVGKKYSAAGGHHDAGDVAGDRCRTVRCGCGENSRAGSVLGSIAGIENWWRRGGKTGANGPTPLGEIDYHMMI